MNQKKKIANSTQDLHSSQLLKSILASDKKSLITNEQSNDRYAKRSATSHDFFYQFFGIYSYIKVLFKPESPNDLCKHIIILYFIFSLFYIDFMQNRKRAPFGPKKRFTNRSSRSRSLK